MKILNSLSGGQTSSYIAAHYPADYNVFSLVRIEDKKCLFPDKKIRLQVEDRIQKPFIGTAEQNDIIYTMLDLEQYIGQKIHWVSGNTFDQIIKRPEGKTYLPNKKQRFCTVEMKINPIKEFWFNNIKDPVETRIGFRANEMRRAKSMLDRCKNDGFIYDKFIVGKSPNGRNVWKELKYQKPVFPLIDSGVFKDKVIEYWKNKPVRFAFSNNCVGCFHRSPLFLKKMSQLEPDKMEYFASLERNQKYVSKNGGFKTGITYDQIISWNLQHELFESDFSSCDSGYCGL